MTDYSTLEQVQAKAATIELMAINFVDAQGGRAANPQALVGVVFTFIDGVVMKVDRATFFDPAFDTVVFSLRPSTDHS
mgnify:CR=1 FL=1